MRPIPTSQAPANTPPTGLQWDVFCRVIDNFGDLGVCWRLAADLAGRGHRVRLWVDDARALAWLAPQDAAGVSCHAWPLEDDTPPTPGQVVIEAFGCEIPRAWQAALAQQAQRGAPAVWINLEYLSAESYVERSHRLASPQFSGPAAGLSKWFFYPGFTPATGGLLREPGLMARRQNFDRHIWLSQQGLSLAPGERLINLFCYPEAPIARLLEALMDSSEGTGSPAILLLAAPGAATRAMQGLPAIPGLRWQAMPWLSQTEFDNWLWAGDLNLVRGEDSFVRAQWAGQPFVWQIYAQDDGVHADKLEAFLDRFLAGVPPAQSTAIRQTFRAWNGLEAPAESGIEPFGELPQSLEAWAAVSLSWRKQLLTQSDLLTQLLQFVAEKR